MIFPQFLRLALSTPPHLGPARRLFTLMALTLVVLVALPTGSAWAGRMLVTGHDADLHCSGGSIDSCASVNASFAGVGRSSPCANRPSCSVTTRTSSGWL